jgi:hypothetical protein
MIRNSTIKPAYLDYQLLQGNGDPTGGYATVITPGSGYFVNIPALPSATGTGDYRPSHYFALHEPNMLKVMLIGFMTCPGEPKMFTLITTRPNTSSNYAAGTWREMLTPSSSKISDMDTKINNLTTNLSDRWGGLWTRVANSNITLGSNIESNGYVYFYSSLLGLAKVYCSFNAKANIPSSQTMLTLPSIIAPSDPENFIVSVGDNSGVFSATLGTNGNIYRSGNATAIASNLRFNIIYKIK